MIIYYKIEMSCGLFELHSGIYTKFGGMAWNYVRSEPFKDELATWAEGLGWTKYEEEI